MRNIKSVPNIRVNRWVSLFVVFAMVCGLLSYQTIQISGYVSALGNVLSSSVSSDTLTLTVDNGSEPGDDILEIQVCADNIIRFNYRPNGVTPSADTPTLDPNKTWASVGATIDTSGNPITITTNDATVEIATTPCRVTVKDDNGTSLLWESSTGGVFYDGVRFVHNTSDNVYGIRGYDFTEGNGDILRNNNTHAAHAGQQGDAGGPFMWSTSGYGLLVDSDGGYPYTNSNDGKMEFYYGGTPTEGRRYFKTDVEYFVMLGTPKEIMGAYVDITGAAPMMPDWSLGFSNFEWDSDQSEITSIVDTYRAKNIPIDSYGLDYDWKNYGQTNYGEFTWNTTNFPSASTTSFKTLMDGKGINLIGITKPRIVTTDENSNRTTQYWDAENNGYWYPGHYEYQDYFIPVNVRSIDPYVSGMRAWFWDHSEDAFDKGIVGWWNDETDKVSSGMAQYWFGNFTTLHLSQAIYEGQRDYATNRVWQTARTFYPGTQRFATTLWSGDIGIQYYKGEKISWTVGMQEQRATMLSSINMGQAKWGMDIGGFNQADGTTSNPSPELYSKWVAFGSSTPVFRVHGNNYHQRQPWYYGNTAEELAKMAIQQRYSLMPYMYAYEYSAYDTGIGMVRPLVMEFPTDSNVANYTDAWMFGDYILSAPVVDETQGIKSIYLPSGSWTDLNTGIVYNGGSYIDYPVDTRTWTDIPMFAKEGAIIPSQEVLNYVDESTIDEIMVDIFPSSSETSFDYYADHGDNYDYETGTYYKQEITASKSGSTVNVSVNGKSGSYSPSSFDYIVKVHGKAASSVTLNGGSLTELTDLNALKAASGQAYAVSKDIYGDVTYVKVSGGSSSDKDLVLTGSDSESITASVYEAEEASLSGDSLTTMASTNTNHSNYSGSGFVDGLNNDNAAVTFYPKVTAGGDYEVTLRYANATGSDKTISIFVNGERVKQTTLPSLANWDTWGDKSETIPLTKGANIVTYKYYGDAGDSGNVNIDYISVPFVAEVSKYEAESAKLSGSTAVDTDHYYYSGTGFVDGYDSTGSKATFSVYAPSAGTYNVSVRYANGGQTTRTLSTYVNGSDVATASFTSPSSNWNEWSEMTQSLSLNAGLNTIAYVRDSSDSGQINIDRILVDSATIGSVESETNLIDNGGFERTDHLSDWTEWHPSGQELAFGVDSGSGSNPPQSPWTGNYRAYMWDDQAYKQSIHQDRNVDNGTYRFEAMVKLSYTTPYTARAEISNYGGNQININLTNNGEWTYISYDVTVTNGYIDVGFYVDSPGHTTLHIDDVRLSKIN